MNSELFFLCKSILLWWGGVKEQYVEMPEFVKQAAGILGRAVLFEAPEEDDGQSQT